MIKKRLFLAVNFPEKIKKELYSYKNGYSEISARWTKKENLHITLLFVGFLTEKKLNEFKKMIIEITQEIFSFQLTISKIVYGPPELKIPRMIWALIDKSNDLRNLEENVEKKFSDIKIENFKIEKKCFSPHITLARINQTDFRKIEFQEIPEINRKIDLKFKVNSIELMESELKRTEAEYKTLDSFSLKQKLKN